MSCNPVYSVMTQPHLMSKIFFEFKGLSSRSAIAFKDAMLPKNKASTMCDVDRKQCEVILLLKARLNMRLTIYQSTISPDTYWLFDCNGCGFHYSTCECGTDEGAKYCQLRSHIKPCFANEPYELNGAAHPVYKLE